MTTFAGGIVELAWEQIGQIALVAAAALVFSLTLGRRHAHLSYLLWMMVLVKALAPPLWISPTGVFGWGGDAAPAVSDSSLSQPVVDGARQPAPLPKAASVEAVDATVAPGASPAGVPWPEILLLIWVGGTLTTLVLAGTAHVVFRRRWLRDSTEPSAALAGRLADVAARLGLRRSPWLRVAPAAMGPAVVGLWRPVIVLPQSTDAGGEPDRLDAVLAHELVHLRRRDPAQSLVQLAAVAAWWWNPVVWLASRFATWERERCCDEEVLGTLGCPGRFYAQCLIDALRGPRRPLALGVPGALAALPVTRRRLRAIVARRSAFPSRPPRWHWGLAIALALLILPSGRAADRPVSSPEPAAEETGAEADKDAPPEGNAAFQAPELLYLGWQRNRFVPVGTLITRDLWSLDGKASHDEAAEDLLRRVTFSFYDPANQSLPLVLIFKTDQRIAHCPVMATVITTDGKRHGEGTALNAPPTNGMNVSFAVPMKSDLPKWPDRVSLEIRYPIDNVTVVKTLTDIPDEPVALAPGVRWYLDPDRACESDPETRGLRRAQGKTTGVLESDRDRTALPLVEYEARVFLRGADKPLRGLYHTFIEPDGRFCGIEVSLAFDNKAAIERVEFTRQRYAKRRIDNVPLRLDLLPKAEKEEEEADAGR